MRQALRVLLKQPSTWAGLSGMVAVLGDYFVSGKWGDGNTYSLLISLLAIVMRGQDVKALGLKSRPGPILPPDAVSAEK